MATMSASAGGRTIPRDTASAIVATSSAPHDDGGCVRDFLIRKRFPIDLTGRCVTDFLDFQTEVLRVCGENLAILRMNGARDEHFVSARDSLGHQQSFRQRGRAIVHRRVRHFLACQLRHQRLKLENRGQRPLRDLRLVGRVGSEKFAALHHRVGDHRTKMLINAGAEERRIVHGIFGGTILEVLDDLHFRERPRQRKRLAKAKFLGNSLKQFFDRIDADGCEHFPAFRRAFGQIAHQADCSCVFSATYA
jgi:hypothetical protein